MKRFEEWIRNFILKEMDKIELDNDGMPEIYQNIKITFGQFRQSNYRNQPDFTPFPARIIKIKFDTGEWILKPCVDLRELYERIIKNELVGETKIQNTCLADALASGQVEFISNE